MLNKALDRILNESEAAEFAWVMAKKKTRDAREKLAKAEIAECAAWDRWEASMKAMKSISVPDLLAKPAARDALESNPQSSAGGEAAPLHAVVGQTGSQEAK